MRTRDSVRGERGRRWREVGWLEASFVVVVVVVVVVFVVIIM